MEGWIAWRPSSLDPWVASARLRCLSPLAEFRSRGYPVELFDPKHIDRYSAVIYSKLYDNDSYDEARALRKMGIGIVFDLCDNRFYNPQGLPYWKDAAERLRRMMQAADRLVASTETLAEVMAGELPKPRPVTIIGDAVETSIRGCAGPVWQRWFHVRKLNRLLDELGREGEEGRVPLVWFGNHGSPYADGGMLDLLKVRPLLEKMNLRYPLSLTVISNSRKKYHQAIQPWPIPTRYLPWHPETFLPALQAHCIAVIPISVNPFTRCKTNNRLALSLQAGLAVVADSIPSYLAFDESCYLDDWEAGLESYLSDPELRRHDIGIGRAIVAKKWTLDCIVGRWRDFFDQLRAKTHNHAELL